MSSEVSPTDPSINAPTRVLCVDDRADVAWILRHVIDAEADLECVGCVKSCNRLVEEVRTLGAEVVLLDANMPGEDPIVAMDELAAELPHVKTIIYSGRDDQDFIDGVMNAGASGFVSKNEEPESVLRVVREVAARPSRIS